MPFVGCADQAARSPEEAARSPQQVSLRRAHCVTLVSFAARMNVRLTER
jgi:hypothetical protein